MRDLQLHMGELEVGCVAAGPLSYPARPRKDAEAAVKMSQTRSVAPPSLTAMAHDVRTVLSHNRAQDGGDGTRCVSRGEIRLRLPSDMRVRSTRRD